LNFQRRGRTLGSWHIDFKEPTQSADIEPSAVLRSWCSAFRCLKADRRWSREAWRQGGRTRQTEKPSSRTAL